MKDKNNVIEEYKNKVREYLNEGSSKVIDIDLINQLKEETSSLVLLCNRLNSDDKIMGKLNQLANNKSNNPRIKAENFLVSDLIGIYNQQLRNENEKSRFVLGFYIDVLLDNHFFGDKDIVSLNNMASSPEFKRGVDKIRSRVNFENMSKQSFLLTTLVKTDFDDVLTGFDNFAKLTFNLKIDKEAVKNAKVDVPIEEVNLLVDAMPEDDSLEKVLAELNDLIGLDKVKTDVKELINLLEVQKLRESENLKNIEITLHNVFLGPPGTGKTSVARLLARIYKHLGFLSKGQMYETDREGLVAGYVGQTATKVNKAVEESLGGVLFIDEAYALTQNQLGNDYGSEAVNTLIKRMEDHRADLSVVVAGYTEPMKEFIESNPGLRSRFNRYFHFDHFTAEELLKIFEGFCKKGDFMLNADAKEKLSDTLDLLVDKRDDSFGNARVIRNLFEKCVQNQANRIVKSKKISKKMLKTFTEVDIPEPNDTLKQVMFTTNKEK